MTVATVHAPNRVRVEQDVDKQVLSGDVTKATPITQGRNASGRTWKTRPQKRASTLYKTTTNNLRKTWQERQAEKLAKQQATALQKEMNESKRQAAIEKKERRLDNEKRRAENEYKHVQKMSQTLNLNKVGSTLKSMSKKQLRQIKKTRVNTKTGVVEYVPAYTK